MKLKGKKCNNTIKINKSNKKVAGTEKKTKTIEVVLMLRYKHKSNKIINGNKAKINITVAK